MTAGRVQRRISVLEHDSLLRIGGRDFRERDAEAAVVKEGRTLDEPTVASATGNRFQHC